MADRGILLRSPVRSGDFDPYGCDPAPAGVRAAGAQAVPGPRREARSHEQPVPPVTAERW